MKVAYPDSLRCFQIGVVQVESVRIFPAISKLIFPFFGQTAARCRSGRPTIAIDMTSRASLCPAEAPARCCFQALRILLASPFIQPGHRHRKLRRGGNIRAPQLAATLALSAAFAAGSALPLRAQQNWPQRSLRILVGTTPGGSPDIISRLLADKMAGPLGQSMTAENNTGGGAGSPPWSRAGPPMATT